MAASPPEQDSSRTERPGAMGSAGTDVVTSTGPLEAGYYIPATEAALLPQRIRTLKQGDTFALFDERGDISTASGQQEGVFHRDTRYLSRLELFLDDHRPLLLSGDVRDDNSALVIDLVNPDIYQAKHLVLSREMLHVRRSIFVWEGTCYQHIACKTSTRAPMISAPRSCSARTSRICSKCAASNASARDRCCAKAAMTTSRIAIPRSMDWRTAFNCGSRRRRAC